ncbi:hypothetical protein FOMPIDRAFT_1056320 [Fomitopsis schrenkii]|uniref:Uncharacterized protein n=1 Tax=Fomitopsis schrenkii TaxID=2126942 RepID=S8DP22_FOMSC|nr:hypothetical protein FOMPIDRAFT_1056320 [Fomitopsis schrenkii]
MFALRAMEREMCSYVEWQFNIEPEALKELKAKVQRDFNGQGQYHIASSNMPPSFHTCAVVLTAKSTLAVFDEQMSHLASAPHAIEQDSIVVVLPPPLQKVAGKSLSWSNSCKSIGATTKPSKRAPSAEWLSAAAKKASSTRVQDGYVHATSCVW